MPNPTAKDFARTDQQLIDALARTIARVGYPKAGGLTEWGPRLLHSLETVEGLRLANAAALAALTIEETP